ncbi:hypothetical protein LTR16_004763, partial [Cryomyces antarcticus]
LPPNVRHDFRQHGRSRPPVTSPRGARAAGQEDRARRRSVEAVRARLRGRRGGCGCRGRQGEGAGRRDAEGV